MIEQSVSLASNGVVKVPGYEQLVRFGYTKNRGVYRLAVTASGEWEGLTIRCFWHVPDGKDPASSLVVDGYVDVPASVTAQPGNGCVTFEGSDGTKTVTSADLRYRVSANSGTEDGTEPEPGTPAWQQLVALVEQAKDEAWQAGKDARQSAAKANEAYENTIGAKDSAVTEIRKAETDALNNVEASAGPAASAAAERRRARRWLPAAAGCGEHCNDRGARACTGYRRARHRAAPLPASARRSQAAGRNSSGTAC